MPLIVLDNPHPDVDPEANGVQIILTPVTDMGSQWSDEHSRWYIRLTTKAESYKVGWWIAETPMSDALVKLQAYATELRSLAWDKTLVWDVANNKFKVVPSKLVRSLTVVPSGFAIEPLSATAAAPVGSSTPAAPTPTPGPAPAVSPLDVPFALLVQGGHFAHFLPRVTRRELAITQTDLFVSEQMAIKIYARPGYEATAWLTRDQIGKSAMARFMTWLHNYEFAQPYSDRLMVEWDLRNDASAFWVTDPTARALPMKIAKMVVE